MTTLTALTRPRLLLTAGPTRRGFLIGFLAAVLVGLLTLVGASVGVGLSHSDRIMPGVSVAGVPLGGLDRSTAMTRIEDQLPSLTTGSLAFDIDGTVMEVPLADLALRYDLDATVDAALAVARGGNPLSDGILRLRALAQPTPLASAAVVPDQAAMDALLVRISRQSNRPATDAAVTYDPTSGFEATTAVVGLTVDADALRQALQAAVAAPSPAGSTVEVVVVRQAPGVTTRDATAAAISARWMSSSALTLTGGKKDVVLKESKLAGLISFGTRDDGSWGTTIDQKGLRGLLQPVARQVASQPRNASFTFDANGVSGVIPAEPGRRLKLSASMASVLEALGSRASGALTRSAALSVGIAPPLLSTSAAQAAAPKMRAISSWTTFFVPGDGNFWGANITIPARDLDGTVVAPGEWFDFWDGIGPVTVEHGYGYGGAIIGGRSVANGALAGGICSTSTTLFNAAMRGGLEIGDKTNHYYYIDRYPTGLDATVFQTDNYEVNMTFRNDTPDPIVIRAYTGGGFVRFDIWGVPTGRTVSLSAPVTSNYRTAHETTVFNASLAPGTAIRREYMHNGFDAVVSRSVRDAQGNLIHEDTWYSHYSAVNGITEVGPKRSSG